MNWHELPRVCAVRTIQQVAIFCSTSGVSTDTVATDPLQPLPELINDALSILYVLGLLLCFADAQKLFEIGLLIRRSQVRILPGAPFIKGL